MPNRLPLDRLLVPVRQIGARVKTNLARYASPQAQTLLVACLANEADTFERLQAAGKLARSALDGDPKSLLIWQQGCATAAADANFNALIAAFEAAAFRFETFKSKPKSRAQLQHIDLARRGKLHELDLTLALRRGWPAPAATQ
jgi:hypothetical protein